MQMRVRGATSSVSPISLQLSALWIDFLRTEDGFLSAGSMDFPRPLNRFLGIGSNFSHSRVLAVTRVGFNIQPGGHFKEWHCTITAWFILIRRLGFRWIRFKRNVFFLKEMILQVKHLYSSLHQHNHIYHRAPWWISLDFQIKSGH